MISGKVLITKLDEIAEFGNRLESVRVLFVTTVSIAAQAEHHVEVLFAELLAADLMIARIVAFHASCFHILVVMRFTVKNTLYTVLALLKAGCTAVIRSIRKVKSTDHAAEKRNYQNGYENRCILGELLL